jgi:hypothetical protein
MSVKEIAGGLVLPSIVVIFHLWIGVIGKFSLKDSVGPEEESSCSCTLSLTSIVDVGG